MFASPLTGRVRGWCLATLLLATHGFAASPPDKTPPPAKADPKTEVKIEVADDGTLRFDQTTNIAYADKEVVLTRGSMRLTADHVRYNSVTHDLWAEGNVHLYQGMVQWICEHLYYNFDTAQTIMDKSRAFAYPWFVHGEKVEKVGPKYVVKNGLVTTCDEPQPHWGLRARNLDFYPGDKVVARGVTMRVDDVPLFYLPWMSRSLKNERQSFDIEPGSNGRYGPYLLTAYNWYLNEQLSGTYRAVYRVKRGFAGGLDMDYRDKTFGTGKFQAYFAKDNKPNSQSWQNPYETVPTSRYRVLWQDQTKLREDITFKANIKKQSDSRVIEDFFRGEFRTEVQPQSTIEIEKYDPGYMISAWVRPPVNSVFTTTEQLPEVAIDIKRQQLFGSPIYYDGSLSVAHLQKHFSSIDSNSFINPLVPALGVPNDYNVTRFDWLHQISFPHMYFGWLSVIPRAGVRETWYSQTPTSFTPASSYTSGGPEETRVAFPLGVESSFKMSRVYDINDPFWDVHGLRHIIQPVADMAYVPTPDTRPTSLYQFDTTGRFDHNMATTRLLPNGFPAFDQVDAIDRTETVRAGIRNKLQTKRNGETEELANVNVYGEWRGTSYPYLLPNGTYKSQRSVSDIYTEAEARPFKWLILDFDNRVSSKAELLEANATIRFIQERKWEIALGKQYINDVDGLFGGNSDYYSFLAHLALTENWAVRALYGVDTSVNRTFVQEYSIIRDLHDWEVSLNFSNQEFGNGVSEYTVYLACALKTLPNVRIHAGP
ncbi:MAG: putative LPS assembly protein LptD [Verrucomicrobia bacterium]|nr:putative LPS assembly protein LptD [Verrucomicrobiota bacterium]